MFRELLPNAIGPIVVAATLTIARAILIEAYISFLGYGIQPPTASWGNMLNNAQQYLGSAPWLAIVPGLVITLAVTSFNFIGDGLRDALDARLDVVMMTADMDASSVLDVRNLAVAFSDRPRARCTPSTTSRFTVRRARRWRWSGKPARARASPAWPSCA